MVGAEPSFEEIHVVHAILQLYEGRCSRKKLSEKLGVGEGSVRTILEKLRKQDLASSTRAGHSLTDEGMRKAREYLDQFTLPKPLKAQDMLVEKNRAYCIVYGASSRLSGSGTSETIGALKKGAKTSVILVFQNNHLTFPSTGLKKKEYPETFSELNQLNLGDGDVLVLTASDTMPKAVNSSLSVALDLSE